MRSASAYVALGALLVTGSLASAPGCGSSDASEFGDAGEDGGTENFGEGGIINGDLDGSNGNGNFADAACATASAAASRTPVYMQMVLDGSWSMDGVVVRNDDFRFEENSREVDPLNPTRPTRSDDMDDPGTPGFTGKKWLAARGALNAFWDGLKNKPVDNTLGVGLYLFSSTSPKPSNAIDVALAPVDAAQATKLKARINPTGPGATGVYGAEGTPLRPSIRDQGDLLTRFNPSAPLAPGGRRVLVVISDGVPTVGGGETDCVNEAARLLRANPPVSTFVIGVGDPAERTSVYDEEFLARLAVAGGTQTPGCNPGWNQNNMSGQPCHFQVTPGAKTAAQLSAEFSTAIEAIRNRVASCEFPLQKPAGVGELDPSKVNVLYTAGNGSETPLKQDPKDGWTYDAPAAPTRVVLNGKACNTLKADPNGKIRIVVGCKTETIQIN